MSTLEPILARAMSDIAFAEALFADPENALAGYNLPADEIAKFKGMPRADFEDFASASPEDRKSFVSMNFMKIEYSYMPQKPD